MAFPLLLPNLGNRNPLPRPEPLPVHELGAASNFEETGFSSGFPVDASGEPDNAGEIGTGCIETATEKRSSCGSDFLK